jgi:hypothetical protein
MPEYNSPRRRDRERPCAWHSFGPTACTAFVINDAMVKLASAELPSGEIIFIRGALATVMLSIGVLLLGASRPSSLLTAPMMLVRLRSSAAATVFILICLRCRWRRSTPSCR